MFEVKSTSAPPEIDVLQSENLQRGSITAAWNLGLRNPQAKLMSTEMYNSGCVNPQGCVNSLGFKCVDQPVVRGGFALNSIYDTLNKPYMPDASEYKPPAYMMGMKNNTINSVTGWRKSGTGEFEWQQSAGKNASACVL